MSQLHFLRSVSNVMLQGFLSVCCSYTIHRLIHCNFSLASSFAVHIRHENEVTDNKHKVKNHILYPLVLRICHLQLICFLKTTWNSILYSVSCSDPYAHVNCIHIRSLPGYAYYGLALHNGEIYIKIQSHIFLVHFDIRLPFYHTVHPKNKCTLIPFIAIKHFITSPKIDVKIIGVIYFSCFGLYDIHIHNHTLLHS
jgi:hypothetical protein